VPVKEVQYRGLILKAACFQVVGTQRFITSLLICEAGSSDQALVDLPVTHLLFRDETEAIESTLGHGRLLVDALSKPRAARARRPDRRPLRACLE
jgi:hypothetical protein